MFALLEHDTTQPTCPPTRAVHWDLLVQIAGRERLPTWRLARDPRAAPGEVAAERIRDHRALYLDHEGEISGGRGYVRRVDRGDAVVEVLEGDRLRVRLDGAHLRGTYEIAPGRGGRLVFHRARAAGASQP